MQWAVVYTALPQFLRSHLGSNFYKQMELNIKYFLPRKIAFVQIKETA